MVSEIPKSDVCLWHFASLRQAAKFGRYWSNNRQTAAGKLNKYEAIDPHGLWQAVQGRVYERVFARFDTLGFQ